MGFFESIEDLNRCTFTIEVDDWDKWLDDYGKRHQSSGKKIAEKLGYDTIEENEDEVQEVHSVGKLDKELYSCIAKNIVTDEVIITDERIEHIEQRHAGDYKAISNYFEEALSKPDYILDDGKHKNTGMVLKRIQNGDLRMQIIVRVQTIEENNGFKNSIISAWQISETRWNNYLKNKNILYKKE